MAWWRPDSTFDGVVLLRVPSFIFMLACRYGRGGFNPRVAEPDRDHGDVDTGFEEAHQNRSPDPSRHQPDLHRDLLRHADVSTTGIYAREDTEAKRSASENAYEPLTPDILPDGTAGASLIGWLDSLAR